MRYRKIVSIQIAFNYSVAYFNRKASFLIKQYYSQLPAFLFCLKFSLLYWVCFCEMEKTYMKKWRSNNIIHFVCMRRSMLSTSYQLSDIAEPRRTSSLHESVQYEDTLDLIFWSLESLVFIVFGLSLKSMSNFRFFNVFLIFRDISLSFWS